jgi:gliding motility-associated-like protein
MIKNYSPFTVKPQTMSKKAGASFGGFFNFRQLLFALAFLLIIPFKGFSTHIVGGVITYTYNGANNYSVQLILYRDCGSAVAFPASVTFTVLQADGSAFAPSRNFTANGGTVTPITPVLPPCATTPSVLPCVEQRVYTATVNLAPSPGGMHIFWSLCCRNGSISNIVSPATVGETFYAYIPCYSSKWVEDFTLANGTTSDAGPTAWTRTLGVTPPTSAQVNNGQFEIIGSNNGSMVWASQVINIAPYALGVNLSANLSKAGANFGNQDSLKVYYSINAGPKVLWPVNGNNIGNWASPRFATATGLVGNTIQIFVTTKFNANNNSTGKTFDVDMVSVYDNTFLPNSSPYFNALPPLIFCATNSFSINCSATDADGDALVYSMYTPYIDTPNPPLFPNNTLSVNTVTWNPGYSATSPFNSAGPAVTMNAATGYMTGVANSLGQYVFGVKVQEYRGGVLLSEVVRDYQGNTVTCPPFVPSAPVAGANTPLCVGQTLSLTATFSAGATYSWTGPNGFTSTLVNPTISGVTVLAAGVYSVTATVSGCTSPAGTVAVTVNTVPAAPTAGSNSPLCAGQNLSLTSTTVAGGSYNWNGPNSFTSTTQNPTIVGASTLAAGVYSVNATVSGCTSNNATVNVVVNPLPGAPVAGNNSPICAGSALNLTASTIAGATYSWTGPNSFTANVQNPTIAGATTLAAGVYTVTATVAGCPGPGGTTTATVNPAPIAPTAGANTPLCAGSNLNLTASTIAGATYNWTGPNAFTSTLQNPTIVGATTLAAGVYTVIATVAGCPGPGGTINVVVNPIPAAPTAGGTATLCAGSNINLTASAIAGATYNWTGPNSFTSNVQNPTIVGASTLATGMYSVTATVAGCPGPAGTFSVTVYGIPSPPTLGSNSPVCTGQTLSLTATTILGATYNWTGPNSFSSALQNPTIGAVTLPAGGIYSVVVSVMGCGSANSTVAITVNPTPAAPVAGSNSPLCAGSTINLTASAIAGATYNWSGPNTFTSTVQNPTIPGATTLATGVYTVNATVTGCTGPNGTVNVIVNPIPASPTPGSNSPICAGSNLNLTATAIAGATYNWSGPNTFTSNVQNPTIVAASTLASGIYTVNVTVSGCTGPNATISVTVNPIPSAPIVTSNSPLCAGQTLNLNASLVAGATYTWNGPNAFTSNVQNPTIVGATTLAAGTYTVKAIVAGCTSANGTGVVTVNPSPAAPTAGGTPTLCAGSNINLTASTIAGATYNWTGPNSFTSNVQNPTIVGASTLATGMYSVTATVAGCPGPAGTFSVTVYGIPSPPTLGSNSPVCTGQTLSLTATTILGATYSWTGPNSFTSTLQNPTIGAVTLPASGVYSVLVSVMGCGSANSTVAITVNPTPAAPVAGSNSPLCAGSTINLTASAIAGASYNWSGPNTFTSNVQNPTIVAATTLAAGVYSVSSTVTGCTGPVGTVNVVVNPIPGSPVANSNSPICAGSNLNLTASTIAGAAYNWSGPNTFTSNVQNPTIVAATTLASGVYTVNATVAGCTGPNATISVTVNPIPASPIAGSNAPICALQTLSLTASTIAGATYSWTGPNTFTSNVQNPTISNASTLASGNYTVTVNVAGCNSPISVTSVTVNPAPPAPTAGGTPTLCAGSNINLTASTIAGATYNWSGPNSFASGVQNPTIVGATSLATGVYSVFATVAGCPGPAGTVSVTVYNVPSSPTLTATNPACIGQNMYLTAQTILGATYNWSGPLGYTSSVQNPTITGVTAGMAGTYSVLVTVMGCGSANSTISVIVNPTPAAPTAGSNSPLCSGQTINLTASTIAGATYSWTGPNTFTDNIQNPSIPGATTLAAGVYSVSVTVAGCTGPAGTVNVAVNNIPNASASATSPICVGQTLNLSASTIAGAIYSWSGPNSFTSSVQNPNIPGATILASGTYSVFANVGGCIGPIATVNATVSPIPAAPVASNNSPICALQTLSLTSGTVAGATYSWIGPNTFTSSVQNPTIPGVSTLAAGVYSVNVTVGGCPGPYGTTTVVINPAPSAPTANANTPLCIGGNINLTASTIAGATYNWTGPNSFTSTTQNPTIVGASTLAAGVYSVTANVAGCPGPAGTISVTVSTPAILTTGGNPIVCANNNTVSLSGTSSTGSGTWTSSGTGVFSPNSLTGTYVPSGADVSAGAITLTLTSTNNGGCAPVTAQMTVNITPAPTANAGPNQSICANNSTVSLGGTVTIASGGIWSSSGTGTFTPNNTTSNPQYVPSASDISGGSVSIFYTTTGNGNCNAVTDTMVITFFPAPVVSGGPNLQYVCKNNPNANLNATSTTGSVVWTTLGTGVFTPTNTILNPTYNSSTADTTAGSVQIIITSSNNGSCNSVSDTIKLIYTSTITISAGASQTVCSNNPAVSLTGTCTTGVGTWTTSGSGTFSPNALTGTYVPSASDISAGTVTLTVTSGNNGTCLPITSTIVVNITPGPTANAGINQSLCANNATVTLSGSVTIATGGQWSSSGTGTFTPSTTSLNTTYIPSSADTTAGSVMIFLTTTGNGSCFPTIDTMIINFTPAPLVNAPNVSVCRNNPNALLNGYSSTGTGTWTTLGSGVFNPNNTVPNPTYIPSTADTTAGSVFIVYTSTGNGSCKAVTDTLKLTFSSIPTVTAGTNQIVCSNNNTVTLSGISSTSSGTWTSSGTGTFAPNTVNGNYIPSTADISAGVVTLTLTTTNNGGCNAVSGVLTLTITPGPTAAAGADQILCSNNATVVLNGSVTVASGGQWSSSGTGTFTPNNTSLGTTYIPSSADTTAGSVTIYLTTTGNGNCNPSIDTMKINFTPAPLVNAGNNIFRCKSSPDASLNGYSSTGTGTWTSTGSGAFNPNNNTLNGSYLPSSADTAAGSVILILTSTNNGSCKAVIDSVKVTYQPKPIANFIATSKCVNTVTTFTDASTGSPSVWLWTSGANTYTTQTASTTFTSTGNQTVSLVVTNAGGCKDSIAKTVYINQNPNTTFTFVPQCLDSVMFASSSSTTPHVTGWAWNFGDTTFSAIKDPNHTYKDTGTFYVTLVVKSDSGCVASYRDTVHVVACSDIIPIVSNPAVPSGFTPNGDGKNDILFVKGGPFKTIEFRIFNEWGNQIFKSDLQSTGWDGTFKHAPQAAGRYLWTLTGEAVDGRQIRMSGEVILSR